MLLLKVINQEKKCSFCSRLFIPKRKNPLWCEECSDKARKKQQEENRLLRSQERKKIALLLENKDDCDKCSFLITEMFKQFCGHETFKYFEESQRVIFCKQESKDWCPVKKNYLYKCKKDY